MLIVNILKVNLSINKYKMDLKQIHKSKVWDKDFENWDDILDNGILKCEGILTESKLMLSIMRTGKILEEIHSKFLSENFDLSIPQLSILEILYFCKKSSGLTQSQLAKNVYSSNANISSLLNRMEIKNIIKREENKNNKREKLIKITSKGKVLLEKVLKILNSHKVDFLNEVESKKLIKLLQKIRKNKKINCLK